MLIRNLIEERHVGLLYSQSGFEKILECGSHFFPCTKTLQICSLKDFPAQIPNLEWLIANHGEAIADHLDVVQTGTGEVAMVSCGQKRHIVRPNSTQAFWKKYLPIKVQRTTIENNLKVPASWLAELPIGISVDCVKPVEIPATGFGLLFVEDIFCDYLGPGRHAYFDEFPRTRLTICSQSQVIESKEIIKSIVSSGHPVVTEKLAKVETNEVETSLWWERNQLLHVSA